MAAEKKKTIKTQRKGGFHPSKIKESTLRDLDFYIFHGCGD